jgi:hypothetical protein
MARQDLSARLNRRLAAQAIGIADTSRTVVRQQLAPLVGSVAFPTIAASIVQAQTQTAFVDRLGVNQASGILQSNATSTFSGVDGGLSAAGSRSFLLGMGVQVYSNQGAAFTTAIGPGNELLQAEVAMIINQTSLNLRIGSSNQQMGKIAVWPGGVGVYNSIYATNGFPSLDSLTFFSDPVILDPFLNFAVDVTIEGNIDLATSAQTAALPSILGMTIWFPRVIDFSSSTTSGA